MAKLTVEDLDLAGKKVLMRVDFNVPIKDGVVGDDNRIVAALPTIKYVLDHQGKAILFSHLGRIKKEDDKPGLSMRPVAERLSNLLNMPVTFVPVTEGPQLEDAIAKMEDGQVLVVQNTRYEDVKNGEYVKRESGNDPELGKYWASLGDLFINDAFGTAHRKHASNVGIASNMPGKAAAGFLMEKEIKFLGDAVDNPERPFVAILGGAKVSDKIGVIDNLLDKANRLVIGGGMAYTFLKAKGYEVGTSLLEEDQLDKVKGYIATAEKNGVELVLPTDVVVNAGFPAGDTPVAPEVVAADAIPADKMGLDIGPDSQKLFHDKIVDSKTVVWNGPMGVFEVPEFAAGTKAVAQSLVDATAAGAFTIVGGGDSASAVRNLGFPEDGFSHISTGGGASLEFLEGKELPGLKVLD